MTLPPPPSFRLDGKRAVVTGASRGIGLGCAAALAGAGAHVVCAARGAQALEEAVEAIRAEGLSAEGVPVDVTDVQAIGALFSGGVDVLVNAAGMARHGPAANTAVPDYDAVMDVNVKAAFFLAARAAERMAKDGGGAIVQISSQMGHVGGIDRAVYCATKHALEGMTKAMAIEWGAAGVRVNTVCPTFVRTELTASTFADPERAAWIASKIKLGRVAEVEDVTGAVVFLASPAAAMITGTHILVDGGWTAG